jgi:hypothetical protein
MRPFTAGVLLALALLAGPSPAPPARLAPGPAPALAVEPGASHARLPKDLGLAADPVSFPAADSVAVAGWWFQGPRDTAVIVLAPHATGTMADLLPAAKEFLSRGFGVLTFDYRGFGPPAPGRTAGADPAAADSLRSIVFASAWVEDMLGALRYARAHTRRHVFAWGQDLGSAVALAAAARERPSCDGVAIEGVFRTAEDVLLANGTAVDHDLEIRHRRLVRGADNPIAAASRVQAPIFAVLAGKDEVTPPDVTFEVVKDAPRGCTMWKIPGAGHAGLEQTPGYYDRLVRWFKEQTYPPPGGGLRR